MASLKGYVKAGIEMAAGWFSVGADVDASKHILISKLENGNLRIDDDALQKVFNRPELRDKKLAIISIVGKMQTGKSFLMNYVMRYFRNKGWENSDWMVGRHSVVHHDGLAFTSNVEPCTAAICIFGKIFEVPVSDGETMMVMLMDTQGPVNNALFTMATLMSSVVIFNSKDGIDSKTIQNMKSAADFAFEIAQTSERNEDDGYMRLQNLMILARDFLKENIGLDAGNKYLQEILKSEDSGKILTKSFDKVECFAMPDPDLKATTENFQRENQDLNVDFLKGVKEFVEHIASPKNLLPKQSSRKKAISSQEMLNAITFCYDTITAKKTSKAQQNEKMKQIRALNEEAVMKYHELMKTEFNENDDIRALGEKHNRCKKTAVQKLKEAELGADDELKRRYFEHFYTTCDEHFKRTQKEYEIRQEKKRVEIEGTQAAVENYESMMKEGLSKPLADEKFEELHNNCENRILEQYRDTVDLSSLKNFLAGNHENLKDENKNNRKQGKKATKSKRGIKKIGKTVQKKPKKWLFKITYPKEDKNFLISKLEGKTLRMDHDALRRVFIRDELKGKKFAIISIAGKMRTGKSFLMNYVLRYLREKGWENKQWMGDDDCAVDPDGFTYKSGVEPCTTGICVFGEIFEVPILKDETMMVMLMDTQGLFDHNTPKEVNNALLTLTTLMSSVQIYNSKDNIDTQRMEHLKTCVDFALESTKTSENNKDDGYIKLQNLIFLIRDFDAEICGLDGGNKYLQKILDRKDGGDDLMKVRSCIKQSFSKVEGFAIPHPGLKTNKKGFKSTNKELEQDFLKHVEEFVEHIMSPKNLLPKQSSTNKSISSREMLNMTAACDNIFARKMIDAQNMMEMNQLGHFSALQQEAVKQYDELMKTEINEDDDIGVLEENHEKYKKVSVQQLKEAELDAADELKRKYLKHFYTTCDEHFKSTKQEYEIKQEKRRLKLERTKTAADKYESMMKRGLSKPLMDEKFAVLHDKCKQSVLESYGDTVNLGTLNTFVVASHEILKEENKINREEEKLKIVERASDRAEKMWNMFIATCQKPLDIERKREEIKETITASVESVESEVKPSQEELIKALEKLYEASKRQNKKNLKRKHIRDDRTTMAIRKYKTDMKNELSRPVTNDALEKLHEKHQESLFADYKDIVDENLKRDFAKCFEIIKEKNRADAELAKKKMIERASDISKVKWDNFLENCHDETSMEENSNKIIEEISDEFLKEKGIKPDEIELLSTLDRRYDEAKRQNNLNLERKRLREQRTMAAIEKYETKMKRDLQEPLKDKEFEELHGMHTTSIVEEYGDTVEKDSLQAGIDEIYNNLKNENKRRMEEQIAREINEKLRREEQKRKIIARASNRAANMWDEFLTTCKEEPVMEKKKLEIEKEVCKESLETGEKDCIPQPEELLKALETPFEDAKRQNKQNWEEKRKRDEQIQKAIEQYKTMMVDRMSEPMTDEEFAELNELNESKVYKEYMDIADDESFKRDLYQKREELKEQNRLKREAVEEMKRNISETASSMWNEFLTTCQEEKAVEGKRCEIEEAIKTKLVDSENLVFITDEDYSSTEENSFEFVSSDSEDSCQYEADTEEENLDIEEMKTTPQSPRLKKEFRAVLDRSYHEAKAQNALNWEKKREKDEQTRIAIERYKTTMEEEVLSGPVTVAKFKHLHTKFLKLISEVYSDNVDEEALQSGVAEHYDKFYSKNISLIKIEKVEKASNEATNMWELFLNTYRDKSAMEEKEKDIERRISRSLEVSDPKPDGDELCKALQTEYEEARRKNEENWKTAKKEADAAVNEAIVAIRKDFEEIMVDRYIEERAIREKFDELKNSNEYPGESQDLKKYFREEFRKRCELAMQEIMELNRKGKSHAIVTTITLVFHRLDDFFRRLFRLKKNE